MVLLTKIAEHNRNIKYRHTEREKREEYRGTYRNMKNDSCFDKAANVCTIVLFWTVLILCFNMRYSSITYGNGYTMKIDKNLKLETTDGCSLYCVCVARVWALMRWGFIVHILLISIVWKWTLMWVEQQQTVSIKPYKMCANWYAFNSCDTHQFSQIMRID